MLWTEANNARFRTLITETHLAGAAREMGISHRTAGAFVRRNNITPLHRKEAWQPTPGEWTFAARQAAQDAGLPVGVVLAHCSKRKPSIARWKAWRQVLTEHPEYSIAGVARASGFTHGSIIRGLRRLKQMGQ